MTRGRIAAVAALVLLGLMAVLLAPRTGPPPTGSPTQSPLGAVATAESTDATADARFFADGLFGFDLPSGWRFIPMTYSATSFHAYGFVSSEAFDVSTVCQVTGGSSTCSFGSYVMDPANVVILLASEALPPFGDRFDPVAEYLHPTTGEPVVVGGVRAVFSQEQAADGRLLLSWRIMRPDSVSNWIQVNAEIRGPGGDELAAKVVAAIGTLSFQMPLPPLVEAAGPLVAASAMLSLRTDQPGAFDCYPPPGQIVSVSTLELPDEGRQVTHATCQTTLAPTELGLWKLELTARWPTIGDQESGVQSITLWLSPDGTRLD